MIYQYVLHLLNLTIIPLQDIMISIQKKSLLKLNKLYSWIQILLFVKLKVVFSTTNLVRRLFPLTVQQRLIKTKQLSSWKEMWKKAIKLRSVSHVIMISKIQQVKYGASSSNLWIVRVNLKVYLRIRLLLVTVIQHRQ